MARRRESLANPNDRGAIAEILSRNYAQSYRIAAALSGSEKSARKICRRVLRQSLNVLGRWETEDEAARWFAHYTVLTTRQFGYSDGNILANVTGDPLFVTLLGTLTKVPMQQREAFFLSRGESMDLRRTATAMDCSTEAASNYLVAATNCLGHIAGDRLGEFLEKMPKVMGTLTPPAERILVDVDGQVRRYIWPRRIRRWLVRLLWLIVLAGMVWLAFNWRKMVAT
jgi:hypothetical protein